MDATSISERRTVLNCHSVGGGGGKVQTDSKQKMYSPPFNGHHTMNHPTTLDLPVPHHQPRLHKHMNRNKVQQNHQMYPDDPDSIEFCMDDETMAMRYYKNGHGSSKSYRKHKNNMEPPVRWSRHNITDTMERFQPLSSPSSDNSGSSCSGFQEYSYAYYEPGAVMCHSNIPTPDDSVASTSGPPPPNSIRALLLKTKDKINRTTNVTNSPNFPSNSKHTYTTRYGTQENIYEDVQDDKHHHHHHRGRLVSSEQSLVEKHSTKKEFQHILNNHYRVLEELNLSVEELLMSSTPPEESALDTSIPLHSSVENLSNKFTSIELKDEIRSPISEHAIGEDSGFSGSSSGASNIGSLRHYKTAITRSLRRSSAPNAANMNGSGGTLYGSCRTARYPSQFPQFNDSNVVIRSPDHSITTTIICPSNGDGVGSNPSSGSGRNFKFLLWNKRS